MRTLVILALGSAASEIRGRASPSVAAAANDFKNDLRFIQSPDTLSCISTGLKIPLPLVAAQSAMLVFALHAQDDAQRLHQHKVMSSRSPAPEPGAENELIPSLVDGLASSGDWYRKKRPELLKLWMT